MSKNRSCCFPGWDDVTSSPFVLGCVMICVMLSMLGSPHEVASMFDLDGLRTGSLASFAAVKSMKSEAW